MLATSIAETSLTIEGVRVVVDSGLMRVPRLRAGRRPDAARDGPRQSRANADQRRGRAGRTEPGICYRLWEEAANGGLAALRRARNPLRRSLRPRARSAPLWGVADPATLAFLDPPPRAALAEARALLTAIGALDGDGRITDEGRAIASLALPPRLARMVVDAAREGAGGIAREIAVVLTERGLGGDAVDLAIRLEAFRRDRSARARTTRGVWPGDWRQERRRPSPSIRSSAQTLSRGEKGPAPGAAFSPLGLPRPHRDSARQARRIPDGQWPGGGARSA